MFSVVFVRCCSGLPLITDTFCVWRGYPERYKLIKFLLLLLLSSQFEAVWIVSNKFLWDWRGGIESFYKMCVIEKTSSHFNNNLKGACPSHPTPFKEAIVRSQEIKKKNGNLEYGRIWSDSKMVSSAEQDLIKGRGL